MENKDETTLAQSKTADEESVLSKEEQADFTSRKTIQNIRLARAEADLAKAQSDLERAQQAERLASKVFGAECKAKATLDSEEKQAIRRIQWHKILKDPNAFWLRYSRTNLDYFLIAEGDVKNLYSSYRHLTKTELLGVVQFCLEHNMTCPDPKGNSWRFRYDISSHTMTTSFRERFPTVAYYNESQGQWSFALERLGICNDEYLGSMVAFVKKWKDSTAGVGEKARELYQMPGFPKGF